MATEFERVLRRPKDFAELTGEEQWMIDKNLRLLDWDGKCDHGMDVKKCPTCWAKMKERFGYE